MAEDLKESNRGQRKVRKSIQKPLKQLKTTQSQIACRGGGGWWLSYPWWKKDMGSGQ